MRAPGQYHDPATGWHDNLLRTYDPEHGQFLEPDPSGPYPATKTWAMPASNPAASSTPPVCCCLPLTAHATMPAPGPTSGS
ncbi:RHS repeat-associated core domain-containing protein [Neopusillimonas aromaticivorans]|uniref:RHS repeat-associated core domain-containing protein n=1 Tax=Neopusillimonas aromaticivorans TaxID=2979868 RepID=UPI0033154406